MKVFGVTVLIVAVFIGLPWLVMGNDFYLYRYFAPKQAAVQRKVFEETKSYRQGMVQELQNMQFEYVQADDAHKSVLRSLILHRAADFPEADMPSDLGAFIAQLRSER